MVLVRFISALRESKPNLPELVRRINARIVMDGSTLDELF